MMRDAEGVSYQGTKAPKAAASRAQF